MTSRELGFVAEKLVGYLQFRQSLSNLLQRVPMKYKYLFGIVALGVFHGSSYGGQGIQLFTTSDIVRPADEASLLTTAESVHLNTIRKLPSLYKSVQIVHLNRRALVGSIVTIALPDGSEYTYKGTASKGAGDQFYVWKGSSERGTLVISYDENTIAGEIRENGHIYEVSTLSGGRVEILTEAPSPSNALEPPSMSGKTDPIELQHPIRPLPQQPASSPSGVNP